MKRLPLSRSKHLVPFASLLKQAGEPIGRVLTKARLPGDCLDDAETVIPADAVFRFREFTGKALGQISISLNATRDLRFSSLGAFGRALLGAPTLYRLLTTFRDHMQTQSTITKLDLTRTESGDLEFCYRFAHVPQIGVWHSDLYTFLWAIKIVRLVSPDWSPSHVWSLSSLDMTRRRAFEEVGVGRVDFGRKCTGFLIPSSMVAMPLTTNKLQVGQVQDYALRSDNLPTATAESLRKAIRAYSSETWLSVNEAAEAFGVSVRTIQRLLATENTTYRIEFERTRMEMAVEELETSEMSIDEIARHLGYRHQANFSRAFTRWSRVSPSEYRQRRRSQ